MNHSKANLLGLNPAQIKEFVKNNGLENFRAKQICDWIYKKNAASFDEMTNLSKGLREKLKAVSQIGKLELDKKSVSGGRSASRGARTNGHAVKYLFKLSDGSRVESVKIGDTICVSTQVGCPMGCKFCATAGMGFKRNLTSSEMLDQVIQIKKEIEGSPNVVFMGMGEPLLNYENLMSAVWIMNSPECMNIGARRITVSTCGLPAEIRKLANEKIQINLSVSLNAPNDSLRTVLMPVNRKHSLESLMASVDQYISRTNRRVSFEYIMIMGVNDTIKDSKDLSGMLKDMLCHVNLISFNPHDDSDYMPSSAERMQFFRNMLVRSGTNATIRKSAGGDINAACGQLAIRPV
ncbi:MAG: 23S rRNA (adenine(2503)-C(2))-methyltransferase RlmN [Candidatus Margulisiibacteriota bacterium]